MTLKQRNVVKAESDWSARDEQKLRSANLTDLTDFLREL